MEATLRFPRLGLLLTWLSAFLATAAFPPEASGQQLSVGQNINMVGGPASLSQGPPFQIVGDPYLQRQNEPSMACSSRNPVNCLAAANDYRLVGTPGVQDGKVTGDAWIGVFWSHDEGLSWQSTLLPGFPQDTSAAGAAFPLRGRDAAADPVVRAGTNGLFYLSGIAFNRNSTPIDDDRDGDEGQTGGVFVSLFVDDNNTQRADVPIRYVRSILVDDSETNVFLDKPWIAVDIPRGAGTCTIPASNGVAAQTVPAGNVYVAYAKFYGTGATAVSDVMFSRSTDCGGHWSTPIRLYNSTTTIGQGASLTVDPVTGNVLVSWREFATATPGNRGRIMAAKSTDFGQSFGPGVQVGDLGPMNPPPPPPPQAPTYSSSAFDQPTLPVLGDPNPAQRMFRTNGYPAICADTTGRYRLAWAQRWPTPADDSRIVISTSPDGLTWSAPNPVENYAGRGHQFMPAIACTADRATLAWYDQRFDYAPMVFGPAFFGMMIFDLIPQVVPHTIDVRSAQSDPSDASGATFLPSTQVSRYQWAVDTSTNGAGQINGPVQLEFNFVNWPLFAGGQVPFIGDYIELAQSRTFKPPIGSGAQWTFDTDPDSTGVLHAAWTDNRDIVKPDPSVDWTAWAPPGGSGCVPNVVSNRNQNVYTSRLSRGLVVGVEGNSRLVATSGSTLQERAFAVYVQNATTTTRHFRLDTGQLPGGVASFTSGQPLAELFADIAPLSTVARTIFVPASQLVPVVVSVVEVDASGAPVAAGLTGSAVINSDGTAPPPIDGTVATVELHTPLISDALVSSYANPAYQTPTFINPTFINPTFINPTFINPTFINPTFINPTFINPTFINPTFINPTFINPTFINPTFINQPMTTDLTWQVTNTGNVASGYNFSAVVASLPPGGIYQLIINRLYSTPGSSDCSLGRQFNANIQAVINNPVLQPATAGNPLAPDATNATFSLASGDSALVTLRVFHDGSFNPASATAETVSQAANSDGSASAAKAAPALGVPTGGVAAEATGPTGASVNFTVTAVDGANAPITASCSPASGSRFPIGTTTVTCTASDASIQKTTTASFVVTVGDHTPPAITVPGPVTVEATGPTGAIVTFAASATDAVDGSVAVTCLPASGSTFALGTATVTCSATDAHGNVGSAGFAVTVGDSTPPVLTVPAAITAEATSASGAVVSYGAATWTDLVSGSGTATCVPASGSTFPLGTTTVICSATDAAHNTGMRTFAVTVRDTTPPVLVGVPANITAEATSSLGAAVTFATPTATDAVTTGLVVTCSPASGSTFAISPMGTTPPISPIGTTVTCSATDAAGNTGRGTFTVAVVDTTPPAITVPAAMSVAAAGSTGTVVTYTASAQDAVDGTVPVTCTPASGSLFPIGNTAVSCVAVDAHGNASAEGFTVTVQVRTAPVIQFHPDVTVAAASPSGVAVAYVLPLSTDQFGNPATTTCMPAPGSVFPVGSTPVKCDAVDSYGNHGIPTSFNVIVTFAGPTMVTIRVAPGVLWDADGRIVPVNVRGRVTSPAGIASASYTLQDSEGLIALSGPVKFGPKGGYSFILRLPARRLDTDVPGRRLVITVTATSKTGVVGSAKATVLVPHDSR